MVNALVAWKALSTVRLKLVVFCLQMKLIEPLFKENNSKKLIFDLRIQKVYFLKSWSEIGRKTTVMACKLNFFFIFYWLTLWSFKSPILFIIPICLWSFHSTTCEMRHNDQTVGFYSANVQHKEELEHSLLFIIPIWLQST